MKRADHVRELGFAAVCTCVLLPLYKVTPGKVHKGKHHTVQYWHRIRQLHLMRKLVPDFAISFKTIIRKSTSVLLSSVADDAYFKSGAILPETLQGELVFSVQHKITCH